MEFWEQLLTILLSVCRWASESCPFVVFRFRRLVFALAELPVVTDRTSAEQPKVAVQVYVWLC